ncbi:MAG: hypothetical protein CME63_13255 [Halobacteriovoraceae bacterium]|nr:hypothetical protein [Halobacteriovoraceae bacterium]MBC98711.1 hypothetical protein [Halobacteriovoraceae bacterium]|tara:strand:+ start:3877 stop:4629 length:753 start_codon:yes stop_codon:yes gene_type:complete
MKTKLNTIIKYFIICCITFSFLLTLGLGSLEYLYSSKDFPEPSFHKDIWKHRVNSIDHLEQTIQQGFKGIEIDLYFKNQKFLVTHESPTENSKLTLEDFLKTIPTDFNLWLDLKNLTKKNIKLVTDRFNELDTQFNLRPRSHIESQNGWALRELSHANIQSLFWIYPYPNTRAHYFYNLKNKFIILSSDFIGISMDHSLVNKRVLNTFENIPLFLFTLNQIEEFEKFEDLDELKVVLTDKVELLRPQARN